MATMSKEEADKKAKEIMQRLEARRREKPEREIKAWDCPDYDCIGVHFEGKNYYHQTSFHLYYDEAKELVDQLSSIIKTKGDESE